MQEQSEISFSTAFEKEVYQGLTSYPKHLSSKYFYDKIGDNLLTLVLTHCVSYKRASKEKFHQLIYKQNKALILRP